MLYIVPSRRRPGNVRELLDAWEQTRTYAELWVCVDSDDPELAGYKEIEFPQWARLRVAPRMRLGPCLNKYAVEHVVGLQPHWTGREVVGFMGDDHRPRTKRWDEIFGDIAVQTGPSIMYGNDLLQGPNLPTAVAMTSDIVEALGYFCPPPLVHMALDNAWKAWGEAIGRLRYVPEVIIEHMHPVAKKSQQDPTYEDVWPYMGPDLERWGVYQLSGELEADVDRLKALIV